MPLSPKHEAFAQAPAKGARLEDAYEDAGFTPGNYNAIRLAERPGGRRRSVAHRKDGRGPWHAGRGQGGPPDAVSCALRPTLRSGRRGCENLSKACTAAPKTCCWRSKTCQKPVRNCKKLSKTLPPVRPSITPAISSIILFLPDFTWMTDPADRLSDVKNSRLSALSRAEPAGANRNGRGRTRPPRPLTDGRRTAGRPSAPSSKGSTWRSRRDPPPAPCASCGGATWFPGAPGAADLPGRDRRASGPGVCRRTARAGQPGATDLDVPAGHDHRLRRRHGLGNLARQAPARRRSQGPAGRFRAAFVIASPDER